MAVHRAVLCFAALALVLCSTAADYEVQPLEHEMELGEPEGAAPAPAQPQDQAKEESDEEAEGGDPPDAEKESAEKEAAEKKEAEDVQQKAMKAEEDQAQAEEEASAKTAAAEAQSNPAADPNEVTKHLKSDVAGAKTVQEVQNAVEARVTAALVAAKANHARETEQKASNKRKLALEKEAADAKEQKTKEATKMEESKLELEKAKQATMNEKNKRKEAESQAEAAGEEVNGLQQVAEAKMKRVQTEEQVKTAEALRQAEEERAKQAAAVRMTAEEKLKTMKLQSGEKAETLAAMPKTVHGMAVAQAAALGAAAKLKVQESEALRRAQIAKTKHDAYELMKTTATEAESAKQAYDEENEKKVNDAEGSEEDLKKALETPFNQKALKQVVEERDELKQDTKDNVDLKDKWQQAEKRAQAAKQAVADGEATNWGQKPAVISTPEAEEKPAEEKVVESKRANDEPSEPKDTEPKKDMQEYENMSEKEIQYWLAKPMKFMEVDPQSPSQVMEEMFQAKQQEADEMRSLTSIQKGAGANATDAPQTNGEPMVVDGEVVDPSKTIDAPDTDPKSQADGAENPQNTGDLRVQTKEVVDMKMKDVNNSEKADVEAAQQAAKADVATTKKSSNAPAGSETGQIEAAKEARGQEPDAPDDKPDMGEDDSLNLGDGEIEQEISADNVMVGDNVGATDGEGIDNANADAELDDMAIEDDDDNNDNNEDEDAEFSEEGENYGW